MQCIPNPSDRVYDDDMGAYRDTETGDCYRDEEGNESTLIDG
jgi:hypothetical protein